LEHIQLFKKASNQIFPVNTVLLVPHKLFCLEFVEEYIHHGKSVSKNPSKSLLYLEGLIKDYDKSEIYTKLLSSKEYKYYGVYDQFFIALAIPSMTGKTQMAFNIRSKRPLYFALQYGQLINRFFSPISTKLVGLLQSDFDDAQNFIISKLLGNQAEDQRTTKIITTLNSRSLSLHC
jgi:hypothetical protein